MKKLQTILAAAALLFATSAFAAKGPTKVSSVVKKAFEQQFSTASNVNWEKEDNFYFATFRQNDRDISVAYDDNGELVGTSRSVTVDELPLSITMAIAEKYEGYKVGKNVSEISFEGENSYYLLVENNKQTIKLKCYSNGDMSVVSKTKK